MIETSEEKLIRHLTRIPFDEMCAAMTARMSCARNPNNPISTDLFLRYEYYGWTQEEVNEENARRRIHFD